MPRLVRWTQCLLFIAGILAFGYVGSTLLDAHLYQVSAKRSLEAQVQQTKAPQGFQLSRAIQQGDVLGRLDIPRLELSVAVLQGTSSHILRLGAGHLPGSALPGAAGNSAIAGHRDTFFRGLKDIQLNDEIQIQTATGLFRYRVDLVRVVEPDDISILASSIQPELTLVTCYPFYFLGPAPKRFIVRAQQI
jgi:sortase A